MKAKYHLWVKQAEKDAMIQVLSDCGATVPEKTQEPAPVVEESTQTPVEQATQPAYVAPPVEQAPAQQAPATPMFANCTKANNAGYYDIPSTSPAYRSKLDGNHDGVACESK